MRKVFPVIAMSLSGLVLVPMAASPANGPAQIVDCSGAAPWCFSPVPIRVTAGSTVTWMNNTAPRHTATSDTGAWTTGSIGPGGTSAAVAFPTAGTFPYHCAIHPSMTGTVIVSSAAAPSSPPVRGLASGGAVPQLLPGAALLLLVSGSAAARG